MKKIFIFIIVIFTFLYCDLFKEQREAMFMASCELVTAPTGGTPANINDYNSQNNILQALLYNLMQNTKHLTEWDTFNEPDMAEGVYVQYGGALFLVQNGDLAIGGAPANGRVYVKTTRAGDALTFSFVNSAAGYSWNNVYCGFYHADGTQLLPYVLYKTASSYEKYTLHHSVNKFDITENLYIPFSVEIGTWDMTGLGKNVNMPVALQNKVLSNLIAIVRKDSTFAHRDKYPIWHDNSAVGNTEPSGGCYVNDQLGIFVLGARSGMFFDTADFNEAVDNRGWINGVYLV